MLRYITYIALMLILLPALAGATMPDAAAGRWWRAEGPVRALQLTEEETARLDELYLNLQTRMIELKAEGDKASVQIEAGLEAKDMDEEALHKLFETRSRVGADIDMEKSNFLLEVRKLLGHERYLKLRRLFQEMKERRRNRRNVPKGE